MQQENIERKKDEELTGRDMPSGDGTVSDEQMHAVEGKTDDKPTGQDHSTENHERTAPQEGVGAVQNQTDTTSDVARINE